MTRGESVRLAAMSTVALAFVLFGNLNRYSEPRVTEELEVVPPVLVQLAIAGGDRFLAANINTWRAIVVSTARLSPLTLAGLATLQEDASWFNSGHEDNYYVATAILPWEGKVTETQAILRRAIDGRPDDLWPAFYWGFNQVHFYGDGLGGAKGALIAAERVADDGSKDALRGIAARWSERGEDPELSIRLVRQMADATHDRALRAQLEKRLQRLEGLRTLRLAGDRYRSRYGHVAKTFDDLLAAGVLEAIPVDPIGRGYRMDADGPRLNP